MRVRAPARSRCRRAARSRRSRCLPTPAHRRRRWTGRAARTSRCPAVLQLVQIVDHSLLGSPSSSDTADRCDLLAEGKDRLDLQRRPNQGLCRPDTSAPSEVLEGFEAEPHLEPLASLTGCIDHFSQPFALFGGMSCADNDAAEPSGPGLAVDDLHSAREPLVADDSCGLTGALACAREAAGDVYGDDIAAGAGERFEAGEEVPHGGLRGRGEPESCAAACRRLRGRTRARAEDLRPTPRRGSPDGSSSARSGGGR